MYSIIIIKMYDCKFFSIYFSAEPNGIVLLGLMSPFATLKRIDESINKTVLVRLRTTSGLKSAVKLKLA